MDQELDHKMILRKDDALVQVFSKLNEPVFLMDQNPTAENLAKLIFDFAKSKKLPIYQVTFWETPSSSASYSE